MTSPCEGEGSHLNGRGTKIVGASIHRTVLFLVKCKGAWKILVNTHIVVRGATNGTAFAFDTLPPVLANRNDHVRSELQTSRMPYNKNVARSGNTHMGHGLRISVWTSRKVLGHLSCAEEQWTPSYLVSRFNFAFFSFRHQTYTSASIETESFYWSIISVIVKNACDDTTMWYMTFTLPQH